MYNGVVIQKQDVVAPRLANGAIAGAQETQILCIANELSTRHMYRRQAQRLIEGIINHQNLEGCFSVLLSQAGEATPRDLVITVGGDDDRNNRSVALLKDNRALGR